ncbi:phage tail protein [Hymenobacter rubripertinctus]|nr:tail fiber protein [Hymenobacter rubripertinctus]
MDNYLGEIRIFGGTFPPVGWQFCSGQLLSISENEALYTLLGTTYGGDGQNTFALPNLQSRVAVGMGQGPGRSNYQQGQTAGTENVTLTTAQLPVHQHPLQASVKAVTGANGQTSPVGAYFADKGGDNYTGTAGTSTLGADALTGTLTPAGGSQPHSNIQPALALQYIIATEGIYPSQQ